MKNNKKILIVGIISLIVIIGVIGGAFAFFIYANTGENQVLVAGDVFMRYTESNTAINAQLMMPRSSYDPETYFEFTIEGKNTHNKDLYYEILINHGEEHETRKTRLDDKFLRFRLEEIVGEVVTPVIEEGTYEEIDNTKIWVNTIKANTKIKTSIKYRLYMWITDEVKIGDLSTGSDYTNEVWNNNVYASIKVSVNGDFEEKKVENGEPAIDVIKATLGLPGGIVGVSYNNEKVVEIGKSVREYRYSGLDVNNYVYFNCDNNIKEYDEANEKCEIWRIIGLFNGSLKIMKNEVLPLESFPERYTVGEKNYYLKTSKGVYWNSDSSYGYNNWNDAGLQYYLNADDGYYGSLKESAKEMAIKKTYYLGNAKYSPSLSVDGRHNVGTIEGSPETVYSHERMRNFCYSGSYEDCKEGGTIHKENSFYWDGIIGLMYPSDYGFSANDNFWLTTNLGIPNYGTGSYFSNSGASNSSWINMQANHKYEEVLQTPASYFPNYVTSLTTYGYIGVVETNNISSSHETEVMVRPCLYLNVNVRIVDGNGTSESPYMLEY